MPLNSYKKRKMDVFDGLKHSRRFPANDAKVLSQVLDRLAVKRVDVKMFFLHRFEERALGFDVNGFTRENRVKLRSLNVEILKILIKGSTEKDIDQLRASAESEHGNSSSNRFLKKPEFKFVPRFVFPDCCESDAEKASEEPQSSQNQGAPSEMHFFF